MALNLDIIGKKTDPVPYYCDPKKVIMYALSVGAGTEELDFIFEKSLKAFPTFGVIPAYQPYDDLMANANLNMSAVLHGEEKLIFKNLIPISQTIYTTAQCTSIYDKGDKGAVINVVTESKDKDGQILFETHIVIIDRSAGNFGGERGPKPEKFDPPKEKKPDFEIEHITSKNQAALYRLNADMHPLHIDPEYAKIAGFKRPVLHGLCTFGFSARAMLHNLCNSNPLLFKSFSARFKDVVYPGDLLITKGWKMDNEKSYIIQTVTNENRVVLSNALFEIR